MQGVFVSIEGGEGVGKSTFLKALHQYLEKHNISVVATREPGGTVYADLIRKVFATECATEQMLIETEALLMAAARAQHVEYIIKPSLENFKWVICDRYVDSSYVYQGLIGGIDASVIKSVNDLVIKGIMPDISFLLECDVDVALKRLNNRSVSNKGGIERYDNVDRDSHLRIMNAFRELARDNKRFVVLNTEKPEANLVTEAIEVFTTRGWLK